MGSYYQPINYLKGGKRRKHKTRKFKGGFYPSVMNGVMSAGKLLGIASLRQGYKLLTSNRGNKSRKVRKNK
jgi:hypothetical protein